MTAPEFCRVDHRDTHYVKCECWCCWRRRMVTQPYSWHRSNVGRLQGAHDQVDTLFCSQAIADGNGHFRRFELRKVSQYATFIEDLDALDIDIREAQTLAIEANCAYRDHRTGRFEWYTDADARKWRRHAKQRAYISDHHRRQAEVWKEP